MRVIVFKASAFIPPEPSGADVKKVAGQGAPAVALPARAEEPAGGKALAASVITTGEPESAYRRECPSLSNK